MSRELIAFNMTSATRSIRVINTEAGRLNRTVNKLKRVINNVPSWWSGGSQQAFLNHASKILEELNNAAEIAADMSEDMRNAGNVKTEEEDRIRRALMQDRSRRS